MHRDRGALSLLGGVACSHDPGRLRGRKALLLSLEEAARAGKTVLLLGGTGIGKTALLAELGRRITSRDVPCGIAAQTRTLGDVTTALANAYQLTPQEGENRRRFRSRLRLAVETRPGVLLLDHVAEIGTATKGFLRTLRGTGLGVLFAADVENMRDHHAIRSLRLTHLEAWIPPLESRVMAALLNELLVDSPLAHPLQDCDRRSLIRGARGNPGRLAVAVELLRAERYWRDRRVLPRAVMVQAMEKTVVDRLGSRHDV